MKVRRALVSVSDKTGVVGFAKGLSTLGIEILSTGGTAKALRESGINVIEISDYTGSPEILDGRLKTLHPKVHGGILGVRDSKKHRKEMDENGIKPIDMVVVNLYPFEKTIAKPDCTLEDAIENIDIGGPTMIRAAAKNYKYVAAVVDPADYSWILAELLKTKGELDEDTTFRLAQKVFAHTARYDAAISNYINGIDACAGKSPFPRVLTCQFEKMGDLRYGENPHQKAAFYREREIGEPSIALAEFLHGKELSYNNIMDADAAVGLVNEFNGSRFVAIVKHANPCGAAVSGKSLADAFVKARASDPVSAFGGIVGTNQEVDSETARLMGETFFEVIVAPGFSGDALDILKKKKNIRLLHLPSLGRSAGHGGRGRVQYNMRKVAGGLLVQETDTGQIDLGKCEVKTARRPRDNEYKALDFAWKICKHVKSNAIVYTSSDWVLGVGAGQMSRVDSARIARMKMDEMMGRGGDRPEAVVCASDAFFPFRDGIDAAAAAGATAVVQPGGSVRDEEVIAAADEHGLAMIFTGIRHFRH